MRASRYAASSLATDVGHFMLLCSEAMYLRKGMKQNFYGPASSFTRYDGDMPLGLRSSHGEISLSFIHLASRLPSSILYSQALCSFTNFASTTTYSLVQPSSETETVDPILCA